MKTLTSSCRPPQTSSTHLLPLALYQTAIVRSPLQKPSFNKSLLKNYRVISNLPFLSKILEKSLLHNLSHNQENHLSNPFQSTYQAGHSTETVMLRIVNDKLRSGQWKLFCSSFAGSFCSFWHYIDHQILLPRLNSVFGIVYCIPVVSVITLRYQSTSVNNSSSSQSQLMYSVPQGSVLGPILFVLYTTPLSDTIAKHSVNHQLFAGDTQLQKPAPLSEVTNLTKELNACTDNIKHGWPKITSNWTKTKQKFFSFPFRLLSNLPPGSITLGS